MFGEVRASFAYELCRRGYTYYYLSVHGTLCVQVGGKQTNADGMIWKKDTINLSDFIN